MPSPTVPVPPVPAARGLAALDQRLAAARTPLEASAATVEHLVTAGLELPSLYLARGGRLRCQASRGYWQVLDGFPPVSGVIARTYRTGEPTVISDVGISGDFLQAVPDVRAEVCVPVVVGGCVVGALNVESRSELPADALTTLQGVAQSFADRLTALGGPPGESRWQQLATIAARLAGLEHRDEIESATLAAVSQLSGLGSGLIAIYDHAGTLRPRASCGMLGPALTGLPAASLDTIASWVASATSCYTLGNPGGYGFTGTDSLRTVGVNAVIVLAMEARGRRIGFLLAADRTGVLPPTEDVELLELLATQASSFLETATALDELRDRAARDPLTGLGHHAAFVDALAAAGTPSDRERSVGVVLIDLDGFKSVNDSHGHLAGDRVLRKVAVGLSKALRQGDRLYRIGGDEFATVLRVADQAEALAVGERLRRAAHDIGRTVSIGIAIGPAATADPMLWARADEALYDVKRGGRDGVRLASPI